MAKPIFTIDSLTIDTADRFNRKRLVEDFSIAVRPGQIFGVVGETGSGKSISTMASVGLAARGLDVSAGSVEFDGKSYAAMDQTRLRGNLANGVSLLFQNAKGALNPYLKMSVQVDRVLKIRNISSVEREERVPRLFEAVGLDMAEIGPKYAHEISGGQAQRVAIACALATDPKLLIADEPTTALDVTTEREVLKFLKTLCQERNMGLILIAHNLALVSSHCTHLSIMHAGHIVETGRVRDVFANPLHPYTQGLLSAIPDVDQPRELHPLSGTVWGGPPMIHRCRFSHRCPRRVEACDASVPSMVTMSDEQDADHDVRCILYTADIDGAVRYQANDFISRVDSSALETSEQAS